MSDIYVKLKKKLTYSSFIAVFHHAFTWNLQ